MLGDLIPESSAVGGVVKSRLRARETARRDFREQVVIGLIHASRLLLIGPDRPQQSRLILALRRSPRRILHTEDEPSVDLDVAIHGVDIAVEIAEFVIEVDLDLVAVLVDDPGPVEQLLGRLALRVPSAVGVVVEEPVDAVAVAVGVGRVDQAGKVGIDDIALGVDELRGDVDPAVVVGVEVVDEDVELVHVPVAGHVVKGGPRLRVGVVADVTVGDRPALDRMADAQTVVAVHVRGRDRGVERLEFVVEQRVQPVEVAPHDERIGVLEIDILVAHTEVPHDLHVLADHDAARTDHRVPHALHDAEVAGHRPRHRRAVRHEVIPDHDHPNVGAVRERGVDDLERGRRDRIAGRRERDQRRNHPTRAAKDVQVRVRPGLCDRGHGRISGRMDDDVLVASVRVHQRFGDAVGVVAGVPARRRQDDVVAIRAEVAVPDRMSERLVDVAARDDEPPRCLRKPPLGQRHARFRDAHRVHHLHVRLRGSHVAAAGDGHRSNQRTEKDEEHHGEHGRDTAARVHRLASAALPCMCLPALAIHRPLLAPHATGPTDDPHGTTHERRATSIAVPPDGVYHTMTVTRSGNASTAMAGCSSTCDSR